MKAGDSEKRASVVHAGRDPEKERAREADECALAAGEKSLGELWRRNAHFARLRVRFAVERLRSFS